MRDEEGEQSRQEREDDELRYLEREQRCTGKDAPKLAQLKDIAEIKSFLIFFQAQMPTFEVHMDYWITNHPG